MNIEKALQIVHNHNKIKSQGKSLPEGFSFTSYAEARKVCIAHGYVWTVKWGGK